MPKLHLRLPGFTQSACGPFTQPCERIQKFSETDELNNIYKNELDKACFENVAYSYGKDLAKRTVSDKTLIDRAYEVSRNPK